MKCIILAAGFSTRLYPLTENFPKALLKVHDKEIISYMLDDLVKQSSIDEVVLVSNQRYFLIFENWIKSNDKYQHIKVLNNGVDDKNQRLGAIGDLQFALDHTGWNDDLLVLPSDTLFSVKLEDFINFFQAKNGFCIIVRDCGDIELIRNTLGCAELDGDKLVSFEEKPAEPKSTYLSVPVYIYPKHTLALINQYLAEDNNPDSPGAIMPWLIKKTPCFAYQIRNGFSYDIGTLAAYNEICHNDSILEFYQA